MAGDDDSGSCRHHRWTRMEIAGRLLVLLSTSMFVSGILITAFAFGHNWVNPGVQLAMQITGPSCLMVTFVMWFFGCIFFHLWNSEWKRNDAGRDQMNRVRLRALKRIPGSPGSRNQEYRDSHIQTLLLGSNTQSRQTSVDRVTWLESSLDGASISSTRKKCSLPTGVIDKNSSKTFVTDEDYNKTSQFQGVESTSYDSRLMDGTGRFVIIHSQVSTCSSYSLAGSRSSRSRGSRTSSNMSSIFLDGASLPEMDGECAEGGPRTPSKQAAGEKKGSVTMATLGVAYPSNYYLGRRRSSGSSCGSKKRDGSGSSGRGGSGQEGGGSSTGGRRGSVPGTGESIQQTVFHVDNFVQGSKIKRKSSSIKTDHIVILKD